MFARINPPGRQHFCVPAVNNSNESTAALNHSSLMIEDLKAEGSGEHPSFPPPEHPPRCRGLGTRLRFLLSPPTPDPSAAKWIFVHLFPRKKKIPKSAISGDEVAINHQETVLVTGETLTK